MSACNHTCLGLHARRVLMQGKHRAYLPWWMPCDAQECNWFGTACLYKCQTVCVCLLYRMHVKIYSVVYVFDDLWRRVLHVVLLHPCSVCACIDMHIHMCMYAMYMYVCMHCVHIHMYVYLGGIYICDYIYACIYINI